MSLRIHSVAGESFIRPSAGERLQVTMEPAASYRLRKPGAVLHRPSTGRVTQTPALHCLSGCAATFRACVWLHTQPRTQPRTSAVLWGFAKHELFTGKRRLETVRFNSVTSIVVRFSLLPFETILSVTFMALKSPKYATFSTEHRVSCAAQMLMDS